MRFLAIKTLVSYAWKALACAGAYLAGAMAGASVSTAVGATLPTLPDGAEAGPAALFLVIASAALGLGMGPLAAGLAVGFRARWAVLALLAYVCLGPNTAVEASIFATLGGASGIVVFNVFASAGLGAALAALFRPAGEPESWRARWQLFRARFRPVEWSERVALALLAFPLAYFVFGTIVSPFVIEAYRGGRHGLALPGIALILVVQLLRSALFLVASVPVLVAWRGSRLALALALGLAHFVLVGLFGMLQAHWLPGAIRLIHSAEILADSLAYAACLVALLAPRARADSVRATPAHVQA